jgi:hypothetical protein
LKRISGNVRRRMKGWDMMVRRRWVVVRCVDDWEWREAISLNLVGLGRVGDEWRIKRIDGFGRGEGGGGDGDEGG